MRKGTVVYLTDAANTSDELDDAKTAVVLGLDPQWTVLAASSGGYYEMDDATRLLIQRGAKSIEAVKAHVDGEGKVQLFGEPMRVFG